MLVCVEQGPRGGGGAHPENGRRRRGPGQQEQRQPLLEPREAEVAG